MKNKNLNKWMWKWHFIGGLVSLPIILVLSVTGIIYLFKDIYESPEKNSLIQIEAVGKPISFEEQLEIAKKSTNKPPEQIIIPSSKYEATEFIAGRHGGRSNLYVNPYTKEVTGEVVLNQTLMYKIRKIHGELFLGGFGTKFVELAASWMVVLILTGLYIWWPKQKWKLRGFFTIRTKFKSRTFWRDLHAVSSFWIFVLLLITLAGGLPWTDVWGGAFKQIQKITKTGFPSTWNGRRLTSSIEGNSLSLDEMVAVAKKLDLPGKVSIKLPKTKESVFSVSNRTKDLGSQKIFHFDQYSGKELIAHNWGDVGVMMHGRLWAMRFHEGLFGNWNWWIMFLMAILFTLSSSAAIVSYLMRKKSGEWGVPKIPTQFKVGFGTLVLVCLLGIIFPLFGLTLVLIWFFEVVQTRLKERRNKVLTIMK